MLAQTLLLAASLLATASAHFSIESPEMRGDSFEAPASQWIYPCAGVNQTARTNRTLWPLTGGAVALDLHHPWTYVYLNLGIGTDYPAFPGNMSITTSLLNVTGNGTFCIPQVKLPAGLVVTEGLNATLQVVTGGASGSALYNCADITFAAAATALSSEVCMNSTGVSGAYVTPGGSQAAVVNTTANSTTTKSAAHREGGSLMGAAVVGVVAVAFSWFL
ncbi:hypothetical protein GLAREA_11501 [Glarea lozoyensis ATCC 20868]|uniref:Copper acquisition factor BIM1-like domain-containing protein n=1 Tax=Glarea lozoyensis (strain ATCC 20868 / MF5171) TaxID=1116229 RepID=S3CG95_GLAL2|nr:uncharacterized protein GLAREA_11501 [Glarea lozoyensis ATCC 20868]EPE24920.1 hypothetical protein GLAREA_11501 [Glarea lozoyensis ATCC 20868]